jgi:hypothetical protein
MPELEGSCHCQAVRFTVVSHTPQPYQRCYCSICRKTQGGGGYAINLAADANTLEITGREHVQVYRARGTEPHGQAESTTERHFCRHCASYLFVYEPSAPRLLHPFASAIDTPLPTPPERTHIRLNDKAAWVEVADSPEDMLYGGYPDLSIEDWHRRNGLYQAD